VGAETSFLVEDFIDSITTQLDRVQDALRIKAVNRPLTYALKDLSLELKVFVELDPRGKVRFRTSGPNEAGASIVHLGFTTITKPMIEENTVSLAASRSPSLEEAGLGEDERRSLERYGVRTVAQLQKLGSTTGISTVSRLSAVPTDRLKAALTLGQPRIDAVGPVKPLPPPPARRPSRPGAPPPLATGPTPKRLQISGRNLIGDSGPPIVKLHGAPLAIAEADDDHLILDLPDGIRTGALELEMPDGRVMSYELALDGHGGPANSGDDDAWEPEVRS
jgi:hypothetical protein